MANPSITCTREQSEHIRECRRGAECPLCLGRGGYPVEKSGKQGIESCANCKGTGRIPRRVTMAFEKQPPKNTTIPWKCISIGRLAARFEWNGHTEIYTLPLPLNTVVEVRVVCDRCRGETNTSCSKCINERTIDTDLRLHTNKEPFCEYRGLCQDGFLGEGSPEYYEILLNDAGEGKYVACYECGIEEVKG